MSDLIDRQDLINGIYNDNPKDVLVYIAEFPSAEPKYDMIYRQNELTDDDIEELKRQMKTWEVSLSTAEPKKGCWLDALDEDPCYYRCSECGRLSGFSENFCPNCGADMRGEEE